MSYISDLLLRGIGTSIKGSMPDCSMHLGRSPKIDDPQCDGRHQRDAEEVGGLVKVEAQRKGPPYQL